jgi:hypothetical protein
MSVKYELNCMLVKIIKFVVPKLGDLGGANNVTLEET